MRTELVHSYSSTSLSTLSRTDSNLNLHGDYNLPATEGDHDVDFGKGSKCSLFKSVGSELWGKIARRKTIERKLPFIRWLPNYTTDKLISDIVAGITVGLTILPQGLAYATVGGLPPQYGLYSGFIGCFVYILLGGTAEVTIGPTAIMAIITFTYTHGKPPAYSVILCFLTGIVTLLMGIFQLGFIVNFISTPVNSGFTSAAAITICSTQIKSLLGLKFSAEGFLPTMRGTIKYFGQRNNYDGALSLVCIVILLILMKLQVLLRFLTNRVPMLNKPLWFISTARNAIVVIAATAMAGSLGASQPFSIVGHIVPGLPSFAPPPFRIVDPATNTTHYFSDILGEEGSAMIVLPLLAIMEHITIAKAFAKPEYPIDASQEMLSIGVSNIIGSFFSSMPIAGSFSRTTVNAMSGAKSPLGGLITGSMVILALRFLTPYFFYIPKAALASVIVCAVIFMVDLSVIKPMWKTKKLEFVPWGLTFLVSLFVGLEYGMMTGFIISVVYLLYYAARPGVKVKKGTTSRGHSFLVVELDRSLTFPSVEYIRYVITKSSLSWGENNKLPMVLDCVHIQFADYTAVTGLKSVVDQFQSRQQPIILYRVKPSIIRILGGVMPTESKPTGDKDGSGGKLPPGMRQCKTEAELEMCIDEIGQRVTKTTALVATEDGLTNIAIEVHTPFPEHKERYSPTPNH